MRQFAIVLAVVATAATVAVAGDAVYRVGKPTGKKADRMTARVDQVLTNGFLSANWHIDKTQDGFPTPSVEPTQVSNSVIVVLIDPLNVHSGQTWRGVVELPADTAHQARTTHQTWRAVVQPGYR